MTRHKISIQAQAATVTASTLTELLRETGTKIMQFSEGLDINHRTAQRRMKEPETLTIKELLALSALLRVPEQQLLDLIRDEYRNRPIPTEEEKAGESIAPLVKSTSATNSSVKKPKIK